jgi:CubicO group peptidase (beta-lactamase class C family)
MTANHLPPGRDLQSVALPGGYGEVGFAGMGFGLTVAVAGPPAATQVIGSGGEYMWGGAALTIFWVDPAEDLTVVFMTQLLPSGTSTSAASSRPWYTRPSRLTVREGWYSRADCSNERGMCA